MYYWDVISPCSVFCLFADAVVSHIQMSGVVGQPVTIQCIYSIAGGVTAMCWGRGPCSLYSCSNQLIKTDGHRVVFQKSKRYQLNGPISKGNVSLTIKNVTQADSGTYCCRVESSGWFKDLKINILLEIKPGEFVFCLPLITSGG
uniref:Ig-like domain-containing protein n=1 Tax=Rhinolophus ferrumequinum TaxID=59479 RepID=A0A671FNE0_RHIFE